MNPSTQDINSHNASHNAAVKVAAQVGQLPLRQYLVQAAAIATVVGLASYVAVDQLAPVKHRQWMKPAALLAIPALPATVAGVVSWVEWSYRRRQRELQHAAAIGVSLSSPTTRSQHEPIRSATQQPGASPEISSGYGALPQTQANQQPVSTPTPTRKQSLFDPPARTSGQPKVRRIEEAIDFSSSDSTGAVTSAAAPGASTATSANSESGNRSGGRGNVVSLFSSPASFSTAATASTGGSAVSKTPTQPRGINGPVNSPVNPSVNSLFLPVPRTGAKTPIDIAPTSSPAAESAPAQSATPVAVAPGTDRLSSQGGSAQNPQIFSDPFGGSAWDEDAVG